MARAHSPLGLAAAAALGALLVGVLGFADRAGAYIYWTNLDGGDSSHISRANNNGTHANLKFIRDAAPGTSAITTDARHVYWATGSGSIGRAKLSGKRVQQDFISGADGGDGEVRDLVVAGGYIYWTVGEGYRDQQASIARARVNGSEVDLGFIPFEPATKYSTPTELAVAGDYLYWTNAYKASSIGRAAIDGTDVNQAFIKGGAPDPYAPRLHNPYGLAVAGDYIYWSDRGSHSIARASLDGSNVEIDFIAGVGRYVSSLAADEDYLYWPSPKGPLMRSNLDGTNAKPLIKRGFRYEGVFVDGAGP